MSFEQASFLRNVDLEVFKEQTAAGNAAITPIEFSDEIYKKNLGAAPFLEFLRSKGRVTPSKSSRVEFPVKEIPNASRASFSANETASDITGSDVTWTGVPYTMGVVAKRVKATDLAIVGNTYVDPYRDDIADAYPDLQSAIDEQIISPLRGNLANTFDNIPASATTQVHNVPSPTTTTLDAAVDTIADLTGRTADFIVATQPMARSIINSDPNNEKIVSPQVAVNFTGKWAPQYQGPDGMIPIIIDRNINARFGVPGTNSGRVIVGCSQAVEMKELRSSYLKEITTNDFSQESLLGSFVAAKVIDPNCFVNISPTLT